MVYIALFCPRMPIKGVASVLKYLSLSLALDLVLGPSGGGGEKLGPGCPFPAHAPRPGARPRSGTEWGTHAPPPGVCPVTPGPGERRKAPAEWADCTRPRGRACAGRDCGPVGRTKRTDGRRPAPKGRIE